jgi:hypothetical protein
MAANPRLVTKDITVTWDGAAQFVKGGTIVDIPAGSTLETAYGTGNLVPLSAQETGADPGDSEPEIGAF